MTGGAFTGDMHLAKQGDGTLVLPSVTETYTGKTDVWAGTHGYVSMVPMQADMSDYAALDALNAAWPDWRQVGT